MVVRCHWRNLKIGDSLHMATHLRGVWHSEAPLLPLGIDEALLLEIELAAGVRITAAGTELDERSVPLAVGAFVEQGRAMPHPRLGRVGRGRRERVEVQDGGPLGLLGLVGLEGGAAPDA